MRLEEVAVQLCRLKECGDFPIKYKHDVERCIHCINKYTAILFEAGLLDEVDKPVYEEVGITRFNEER